MECIKCGSALPDGAIFCPMCGRKQIIDRKPRKRGNGLGTAIKRGKTWTAIWTESIYETEDGKRHQRRRWKSGFTSQTKALIYAANPPSEESHDAPTVRAYYNTWKKSDYLDLSKSKKTAFDVAWKKILPIADKQIGNITINTLQSLVDEKAPTYYPARDIKTLLSHLYKRAVAEGTARTNLSEFIRLPKLEEKETDAFTQEELKNLWDAYGNGDHIIGYVLLMIYTGMMPGELLAMKADMVDWTKREIIGCGLKTKARKERPIVFPEFIDPVLQDICDNAGQSGKVVAMNKDNFYAQYHKSLSAANVRDLPPYSCRHTTATALALGNIAPSVIQDVMRHTKFATTQRYIHPDRKSAHDAINTLKK